MREVRVYGGHDGGVTGYGTDAGEEIDGGFEGTGEEAGAVDVSHSSGTPQVGR